MSRRRRALAWIDDRLRAAAVNHGTDAVGWVSLDTRHEGSLTVAGGRSLYGGQLGIALYLAVRARVGEMERDDGNPGALARRAVSPWLSCDVSEIETRHTGGTNGIGALVYGFTRLAEETGDERYADRASEIIDVTTERFIRADDRHGVVYGNAGLILALTAHYTRQEDDRAVALARVAGDHLLETATERADGLAWETDGVAAAGFAHGSAGVGYALARLAAATGDRRYAEAAADALLFEASRFDDETVQWASGPSHSRHGVGEGWCWGRPGHALARVAAADLVETLPNRVVDRGRRGVAAVGTTDYDNDTLCHGTFGDVAVLTAASHARTAPLDRARRLTSTALAQWRQRGRFRLAETAHVPGGRPSLFRGLAGIGHTLCRLQAPDTVPSVLLLE
ncbi:lanthionine synthetase LanC family protein [Halobaculum sp. MBLA0143]|uniref:lanthionine synthetase LanC family protein n=1 Tax=Halobaculum sp. MBLA0143 TaxID=3079933 RepID=UPI0035267F96